MQDRKRGLLVALSALLAAQVLRVLATLAPGASTTIGGELGRPLGLMAIGADAGWVWAAREVEPAHG